MLLERLLEIIATGEKVAIKIDKDVKIDTVSELLKWIKKQGILVVNEIEPNGYTDGNGISYLTFVTKNISEEPPFPEFMTYE